MQRVRRGARGRKSGSDLFPAADMAASVGLDADGTGLAVGVVSCDGGFLTTRATPTVSDAVDVDGENLTLTRRRRASQ